MDLVLSRLRAKKGYCIDRSGFAIKGVISRPESHARERDVEDTIEGERQQRNFAFQVEVGWKRSVQGLKLIASFQR